MRIGAWPRAGSGASSDEKVVQMEHSLLGLQDKVALVTGAGTGIGRGIARMLARAGCHIAIGELDAAAGADAVDEMKALGRRAVTIQVNVRDREQIDRMLEETIDQLGGLDVCVNNVGNFPGHRPTPFLEATPKFFSDTLGQNLEQTYFCILAEAKSMVARRVKGVIVNIASVSGLRAREGMSAYGAAKAGIINLTMNTASELAKHGIRVNAIAPGLVATERLQPVFESGSLKPAEASNPLGRAARTDELGGVAVFLASDLSSFVTGQLVVCDGGDSFTSALGGITQGGRLFEMTGPGS